MNEIASSSTFTSTPPAAQPAPLAPTPCPFCGSADIDVREGSTFRWRAAECHGCGAIGPEIRIQTMGDGTHEQWEADARERAFKDWNSRAPDPSRAALVAAEAREQRMENLCRRLMRWDLQYPKGTVHNKTGEKELDAIINEAASLALEPLPLAPAPAPEGRGETPRTDRAAKNLDTREEVLDFARSLEIENNELRELKSTWEIGAKRHNEVKAQRAAAVAQAQALREALKVELSSHYCGCVFKEGCSNPDGCAHCAAKARITAALAASEAGK